MSVRTGCCADQFIPCSYHEGWQDALDHATRQMYQVVYELDDCCEHGEKYGCYRCVVR